LVTASATVCLCLFAIGIWIALSAGGYEMTGLALFLVLVIAGLITIAVLVNRHWPISGPDNSAAK
jgi:hypothetical protein